MKQRLGMEEKLALLSDIDQTALPMERYRIKIPDTLMMVISNGLHHRCQGQQLALMWYLVQCDFGRDASSNGPFCVEQAALLKHTSLTEAQYACARKALVRRGWISYVGNECFCINYETMYHDWNKKHPEHLFTNAREDNNHGC